jgi:hypothetical protein
MSSGAFSLETVSYLATELLEDRLRVPLCVIGIPENKRQQTISNCIGKGSQKMTENIAVI